MKADGKYWRRVVPSPLPKRIFELNPIQWLIEKNTVVICAGGGGIPTMYESDSTLVGVEAVIDKDLATELLARELEADLFIMATDADALYLNWGSEDARAIKTAGFIDLNEHQFAAGSMGPKVEAACHFVQQTGQRAAIGDLKDLDKMIHGQAGTTVLPDQQGMVYHDKSNAQVDDPII